jgi:hypothetical protein
MIAPFHLRDGSWWTINAVTGPVEFSHGKFPVTRIIGTRRDWVKAEVQKRARMTSRERLAILPPWKA